MNNFEEASEIFSSSLDVEEYFESISAESTKSSLIKTIDKGDTPLIFLLGDPGVGKTYMLTLLLERLNSDKKILFASEPFSTPESFLHFLLEEETPVQNISELKKMVIEKYSQNDSLIILDEAQLIDQKVLEFIRTLSDLKSFTFLLSMHKEDGEKILKKSHFLSRNHRVITVGILNKNEIQQYIESQLLKHSLANLTSLFKSSQIKQYLTLSKGNFRVLKQLLKHSFSIMNYAKENSLQKYTTPSTCVITMAAIDLGLINA